MLQTVVRGLLCQLQILLDRLFVLLEERGADYGNGRDRLCAAVRVQRVPCVGDVDRHTKIGHEHLCNLNKRLRQERNRVRLLLQKIEHLERRCTKREVHLVCKVVLVEQILERVLRRTALTDRIHGATLEVLHRGDGRVGGQHIQQTEVADADDLDLFVHVELFFHIRIVVQDGRYVGGHGCNVVIALIERRGHRRVVNASHIEIVVVERVALLVFVNQPAQTHGRRTHDKADIYVGRVRTALYFVAVRRSVRRRIAAAGQRTERERQRHARGKKTLNLHACSPPLRSAPWPAVPFSSAPAFSLPEHR